MAESTSILSAVPINPYTPDKIKKSEKAVDKKEKAVTNNTRKYRENVVSSSGFLKEFDRQLQRNKPIEKELAASASALSSIEDPLAKSQFLRSAENAAKLRRQNVGSSVANALAATIEGQRIALQADENSLNRSISERDTARGAASTEYLNFINAKRQAAMDVQGYKDKLAVDQALKINSFAPPAPRSGPAATKPDLAITQFGDNDVIWDKNTGQFLQQTPAATKPSLIDQLLGLYGAGGETAGGQNMTPAQNMSVNQ